MKDAYIAAKERWARKMAGHERPAARSENRLPPGQRLAAPTERVEQPSQRGPLPGQIMVVVRLADGR